MPAGTTASPARIRTTLRHRAHPAAKPLPLARGDDKSMAVGPPPSALKASSSHPVWVIAGLALLTLLAGGGLGWVAIRARGRPEPDADGTALAIEAELQEIIAEHRAGEVTERETSGVAGPPG